MTSLRRAALALLLGAMLLLPLGRLRETHAQPVGADEAATFFEAYYREREEGRELEALVLYLRFLDEAPGHEYAAKAAARARPLVERHQPQVLADFDRRFGPLLGAGPGPVPAAAGPDPEAAYSSADDLALLAHFEKAIAEGTAPPEVRAAEMALSSLADLYRQGRFLEAARIATRSHRVLGIHEVAGMIQRRVTELEALQKKRALAEGFGEGADVTLADRIQAHEDAIAGARTDAGLYAQIAKVYAGTLRNPGRAGFVGVVTGLADPTAPAFLSWVNAARGWLQDQAVREISDPGNVEQAVALGRSLGALEDLLVEGRYEEARHEAARIWSTVR